MPKIKKVMIAIAILLSACLGALICFFTLSALDKIDTKKELVIEVNSVSAIYSGSPVYANSYKISKGSLSKNDYIDIKYTTSLTYVGEGIADACVEIYSKDNVNVTKNYNLKIKAGKIVISKKAIVLEPAQEVSIDEDITKCNLFNIISGEISLNERIIPYATSELNRTNKYVEVGCKILDTQGNDVTSNYDISLSEPVLLEKAPLVITTKSASKVYDGTALYNNDFLCEGLYEGDSIQFLDYTTITDYIEGGVVNKLTTSDINIIDSNGIDVNDYYNIIINNVGILTIEKKKIKVETKDLNATYNGEDYKEDVKDFSTSDVNVKEKILGYVNFNNTEFKNVGTYQNKITIEENQITNNYDFTIEYGTINISKKEVTLKTESLNTTYSGEDFASDINKYELIGSSDENLKNALDEAITYKHTSIINAGVYQNEITIENNILFDNYDFNIIYGTINISKKEVTLKTESLNTTYSGEDFASDINKYELIGSSDENLKTALDTAISYKHTSIINAGVYENVISILDNEVFDNYDFNIIYGTINILKKKVTIETASYNATYSGEDFAGDIKKYELIGSSDENLKTALDTAISYKNTSIINAGTYKNIITIENNELFNNYDFTIEYGIITISKYLLVVTLPTITLSVGSTSSDVELDRNNITISNVDLDDASDVIYDIQLDIKYETFDNVGSYTYSGYLNESYPNLDIVIMNGIINVVS